MKYNSFSRRLFLQGMGKASLALPLLPSLLPKVARAQMSSIPPRYLSLFLPNGPVLDYWWPSAQGMEMTQIFPADSNRPSYQIAHKNLTTSSAGFSYLFDQKFNPYVNKMTFLRGLDIPGRGGHHAAAPLGNGHGLNPTVDLGLTPMPTIDHIMAYAPNFYPNSGLGITRQIVTGLMTRMAYGENISNGFSSPLTRSGEVVHLDDLYQNDPALLFKVVFGDIQAPPKPTTTPIVDSVISDFKRVKNDRNISSEDKVALQHHVDLLAQLESKLSSSSQLNCENIKQPQSMPGTPPHMDPPNPQTHIGLLNDIIFSAFRCGATRVANVNLWYLQSRSLHKHEGDEGFDTLKVNQKWGSDHAVYDIVQKMDSFVEANGKTMLDNSLVHYLAGSGPSSHSTYSVPCLLFGSAGGKIKTGQYIDYRMQDLATNYNLGFNARGLLQNQLWTTIMQSMGLQPADYNMKALGILPSNYSGSTAYYGDSRAGGQLQAAPEYVAPESIAHTKLPLL